MQRRVLDGETAIAHGAVHMHDGVAGSAGKAGVRFRRIDLVLIGLSKRPLKKTA